MSDLILTERDGDIATVIINNPAKRNALSLKAWSRLAYTMAQLSADESLRCVVLRGAGDKAFAAGADISEFPGVRSSGQQAKEYGDATNMALDAIVHCRHPTIAMIHGACTGGGLEVACCCDLRISGQSGRFGVPIKRIGHAFAHEEMRPVLAAVGRAVVLELLLEGRIMGAEEAERRGLVNRMVPDDELAGEVAATAARIAEGAPLGARTTKRIANRMMEGGELTDADRWEGYGICDTEDYAEGVRAFLAKEDPDFKGC